jgi:hypothetical protein
VFLTTLILSAGTWLAIEEEANYQWNQNWVWESTTHHSSRIPDHQMESTLSNLYIKHIKQIAVPVFKALAGNTK